MREFFKGWRRKAGVVTLVIACALAAGWVRSCVMLDIVYFPRRTSNCVLFSGNQRFRVMSVPGVSLTRIARHSDGVIISRETKIIAGQDFIAFPKVTWTSERIDNLLGIFRDPGDTHPSVPMIPYWSIVIPLALLSAYLLLGKPR